MKKNILLATIAIVIISFFSMTPYFNNEVDYDFMYMQNYIDNEQYVMMVEIAENSSISNIDYREFHQKLDDCATKNNMVVAQYLLNEEGDIRKETLYLSSNDLYAKDVFMLERGSLNLDSGQRYSTVSQDKETRLANILLPRVYEIDKLVNSYENASSYSMASIAGNIEENFNQFKKDMDLEYPGIVLHNAKTFTESFSKNSVDDLLMIKLLCVSIIMLLLSAKYFTMQRLISLYKIEGYSDSKIYRKLFLKPFIFINGIALISSLLLAFVFYQRGLAAVTFSTLFTQQFILLVVMELLMSILMYIIISQIPKVSSIKGKNELSKVQYCAYGCKILIVLVAVPILSNQFLPAIDFIKMYLRYDRVIGELENYYSFGAHINSNYHFDRGSDNYISLKSDLVTNNNLFDLTKSAYYDFENFDQNKLNYFYSTDMAYLKLIGLVDTSANENEVYIFTKPNSTFDLELLEEDILINSIEHPVFNYLTYDAELRSYDIRTLLFKDVIDDIPLVYLPMDKGFQGQLNTSVFYYDGEQQTAQEYVNTIFEMHGYTPGFKIDSMSANYAAVFRGYIGLSVQSFMKFTIAVLALITAVMFLFGIDIDNNSKLYAISRFEGVHVYSLKNYFIKFVSASCLGVLLAMMIMPKIITKELIGCIAFICVIEACMYLVFIKRSRRK